MSDDIVSPLKRCTKCGEEKPLEKFSSDKRLKDGRRSHCNTCKAESDRRWRVENPEKSRECQRRYVAKHLEKFMEYQRRYRAENSEKIAARHRRDYAANPEKQSERSRRYIAANPEKVSARHRRYHAENSEKVAERGRQWRVENPDMSRARNQRRRARKRALPNTFTAQEWETCLNYWNGCCAYCNKQRDFWNVLEMEHFIPLSSPGCTGTVVTNMLPACRSCNTSKKDNPAHEWLTRVYGVKKANQILARIQVYFDSIGGSP